ncbi:MAG: hypothetical protein A2Y14_04785 [Verrucomicrobia bacterium GWF2_51_19]|nr:MAG: hypothetical protein A2Y14_04785 [Verrucomicrobia bacterium GWF2_51_19]HCJ12277.1 hypothetical protein [Opitutae bacterium]
MYFLFKLILRLLSFLLTLLLFVPILIVLSLIFPQQSLTPIAEHILEERTGFASQVGATDLDLLKGTLELKNVSISNPTDYPTSDFIALRKVFVKIDMLALKEKQLVFDTVVIDIDRLTWVKQRDLSNFRDFSARLQGVPQNKNDAPIDLTAVVPPLSVVVKQLSVRIQTLGVVDYSGVPQKKSYTIAYSRNFSDLKHEGKAFSVDSFSLDKALQLIIKDFVDSGFEPQVRDAVWALSPQ